MAAFILRLSANRLQMMQIITCIKAKGIYGV